MERVGVCSRRRIHCARLVLERDWYDDGIGVTAQPLLHGMLLLNIHYAETVDDHENRHTCITSNYSLCGVSFFFGFLSTLCEW